jgi:hypothetical protein
MRSEEEVTRVGELAQRGLGSAEIARVTGIPRATVRDWLAGKVPARKRVELGVEPAIPPESQSAYAYLLGLYLGDGHISAGARTLRLRITLDGIYPGIVAECVGAIEQVLPNPVGIVNTPSRAVVVSVYANALAQLFPQHGAGAKHDRKIELLPWQSGITRAFPESRVRGLTQSDGSRHMNTVRVRGRVYRYPRYEFCNHSHDIRAIFCEHLDLLGIPWRRMNRWTISVARREGVARLDEFVGPKF